MFNYLERDGQGSTSLHAYSSLQTKLNNRFFARPDYRGAQRQTRVFNRSGQEGNADTDINVHSFECRKKDPYEIVAKLLDKSEARPTDILDQVGYRIVANSAIDAFKILRSLFFEDDSLFHWSLIRVAHSEPKGLSGLSLEAMRDQERSKEIFEELSTTQVEEGQERGVGNNAASLKGFRSINIVHDIPIKLSDGSVILFPIEAQIVSKQAHTSNHAYAPHQAYKEKRTNAVRERALRGNLVTEFDKSRKAA